MTHTTTTMKRKLVRSKLKGYRPGKTDGPHTIDQCVRQFHAQKRSSDQWLVAICQHVAINRLSRMDIADILMEQQRHIHMTKAEAWTCAGRIWRLSKDEDTLQAMKYGMLPYASRMTITKQPF